MAIVTFVDGPWDGQSWNVHTPRTIPVQRVEHRFFGAPRIVTIGYYVPQDDNTMRWEVDDE